MRCVLVLIGLLLWLFGHSQETHLLAILDGEDSTGIEMSSIVFYNLGVVNYNRTCFSDKNGLAKVGILPGDDKIIVSAFGYRSDTLSVFDTILYLTKEQYMLEGIEITAKKDPIKLNKDTITYRLSPYLDGSEKNLEDAIKKMPGFEVSETGMIRYNGKAVKALMVEDDDMFGFQYTKGTRSLDPKDFVDIQVIKNFNDNPLMKDFNNSTDIGLNVRMANNKKLITKVNFELGTGLGEHFKHDNLLRGLNITKPFKLLSELINNNTRNSNYSGTDFNSYDPFILLKNTKSFNSSSPTNNISQSYFVNGNIFNGNHNLFLHFSKQLKMRINFDNNIDNVEYKIRDELTSRTDTSNRLSTISDFTNHTKINKYSTKLEYFIPKNKINIVGNFNYNNNSNRPFNIIENRFVNFSSIKGKYRDFLVSSDINLSKVISDKYLLKSSVHLGRTTWHDSTSFVYESLDSSFQKMIGQDKLLILDNTLFYEKFLNFGCKFVSRKLSRSVNILSFNNEINPLQFNGVTENTNSFFLSLNRNRNRYKISFRLPIDYVNIGIYEYSKFFVNPSLIYKTDLTRESAINITLNRRQELLDYNLYLNQVTFLDFRTLKDINSNKFGFDDFIELSFGISKIDPITSAYKKFSVYGKYYLSQWIENSSFDESNIKSTSEYISRINNLNVSNRNISFSFRGQDIISHISHLIKYELDYSVSNFLLGTADSTYLLTSRKTGAMFKFNSAFKKINYIVSTSFTKNSTNPTNFIKNIVYTLNIKADLIYNYKNVSVSNSIVSNNFYGINTSKGLQSNIIAIFKPKSDIIPELTLEIYNYLGKKQYSTISQDNFFISSTSIPLESRFFVFKALFNLL